jgi:hypothetical protein
LPEGYWTRETDFAGALARRAYFHEREFPELPPDAQPEFSRLPVPGSEQSAAPVVFATIAVAAEQAALSVQIIARVRTKPRRRKSRQVQPSAVEFASTSPTFSWENLFLSSDFRSTCDFIARYCCGLKFRTAAAACRRM